MRKCQNSLLKLTSFACLVFFAGLAAAADGQMLATAFEKIHNPAADESKALTVSNLKISSVDFELILDSGDIYLYAPVTLDSEQVHVGGLYVGQGRIEFSPRVKMERDQLRRFFDADSLSGTFEKAELFFDKEVLKLILEKSSTRQVDNLKDLNKSIASEHEHLTKYDYKFYDFSTLKNCVEKWPGNYLMVNADLKKRDRILYRYDPSEREEVNFYIYHHEVLYQFFEKVCSYNSDIENDYSNINGIEKNEIKGFHYHIESIIDRKGRYFGKTEWYCRGIRAGTQLLAFYLHPELLADSITCPEGTPIEFLRHQKTSNYREEFSELYLLLDKPIKAGDSLVFRIHTHGDIAERNLGEFFVDAGAEWYPRYNFSDHCTFKMNFKTPKGFDFSATGNLISEKLVGDTLNSIWTVDTPAKNVSFNIGNLEKYDFQEENGPPVEIHFSKELHRDIGRYLAQEMLPIGKNMEKQVAEDIINSLKLFSHHFGEYPYDKMVVTEVLAGHGESFPGFLHLGFSTWVNTDAWGRERLFRAHETAHQWWGTTVGFETYHDQWLSEGFAEYSALMYLQAVSGNDKFLDKLNEYRNDIFSVRKYLFSSGEESGPIALGYRTSSTKTSGDYGLVIYKKGAFVLHMLRNMLIELKTMNEDSFFEMIKYYYESYKNKDATTRDFQRVTEEFTGMNMDWFFNQWVYGTDLPEYEFKYNIEEADDGYYYAHCRISQSNVSENFKMFVPIEVEFLNGKAYVRLLVDKPVLELKLPPLAEKPERIRLNPFESVLAKVKQ